MTISALGDRYSLAVLTPAEAQLLIEHYASQPSPPVDRMREIRQRDPWDTFVLTPAEDAVLSEVRDLSPAGYAAWMDAVDALRDMPGKVA